LGILLLRQGGECAMSKRANEILDKLKAKSEQMWQLAASNACGKQTVAVAHLQHDLQRLFEELRKVIGE
jgi:hypothetical protein